ncbi:MAG: hypothetical protein VX871_08365 [Pseudomonadota bacterium]|nr:hypothetical protein [Pseudomonadota bacterium]
MVSRIEQMVLKFRNVLAETERLDPHDLRTYQEALLQPLLQHARQHSAFYRGRLDPVLGRGEPDFARWSELPILTRAEAQAKGTALSAKQVPPHLGTVSRDETSGSTGRPLRFLKTELTDVAGLAMTDRLYRWWGMDGRKRLASFVSPRRGVKPGTVQRGWRQGFPQGEHLVRETSGDMAAHVDWLAAANASYLISYSSLLPSMASIVLDRRERLPMERIVARGGVVTAEMRALCLDAFGAGIADQYGADEIGQIACECPHCGAYHVSAEGVFLEVVDESGAAVGAGATGRVLLTNLYNYAMPLIRYEIGDMAVVAGPDRSCPIRLPRLEKIIGRYRNVFRLRDGRVLFPNMPMSGFRKYIPCQQLQVVQTSFERIEVRYVEDGSGRPADSIGLETWMRNYLDPCFQVEAVVVDEIPRSPSGKYEDFVSVVDGAGPTGSI